MAASEIYDHKNRSVVMGWLYITYFSDKTTLTHWLVKINYTWFDSINSEMAMHLDQPESTHSGTK